MKLLDFIKKNYQLIIVFVFTFLVYTFLGFYINNGDPTASYGFSHAIKNGEIIYRDFNTISTPLYAFYCSLFLFIFDDFIMFIFAQTILVTVMFYFLFKLLGNKAYIVLLAMVMFKFFGFIATYNFCCLAISVIVLYLEEKHPDKDYLIGFILGLMFLSKQTVGGLFLISSLIICFKQYKKLFKRIIGFIIPCTILVLYLLFNNALYQFIDLCFLGLFDFGGNNNNLFTLWFFISIVLFIISIIITIKSKKKINYYCLMYIGFVLPIFDLCHFAYYFVGFAILLAFNIKNFNKSKLIIVLGVILEMSVFNYDMSRREAKPIMANVNHFKYKYNYEIDCLVDKRLSSYIDKYIEYDPILIMYYSMSYNISHDRNISYFDVFLYGNHGYNGTNKMINKIKKMKNQYFIISMDEYLESKKKSNDQFNSEIVDYIISSSIKIDCSSELCVYYKK